MRGLGIGLGVCPPTKTPPVVASGPLPLTISGCVTCLLPDYDGTTWTDHSASGLTLVNGTAANRPTNVSGVPDFDGTNDYLQSAGTVNLTSGYTLLVRFKISTAKNYNGPLSVLASGQQGAQFLYFSAGFGIWAHDLTNYCGTTNPDLIGADGNYHTTVLACANTAVSRVWRHDGAPVTIVSNEDSGSGPFEAITQAGNVIVGRTVFATGGVFAGSYFQGPIKSVLIYDRKLTTPEIQSLETYLATL